MQTLMEKQIQDDTKTQMGGNGYANNKSSHCRMKTKTNHSGLTFQQPGTPMYFPGVSKII